VSHKGFPLLTTSEVAKKFGVSLANISQKRRKYAESWESVAPKWLFLQFLLDAATVRLSPESIIRVFLVR